MGDDSMENRHYKASDLSVLEEQVDPAAVGDEIRTLYSEICNSWHLLIEIRFKLLAFVPAVSVLLLANLLAPGEPGKQLSLTSKVVIAALGFVATLALFVYDRRNSELHDDLISRGRKIEEFWGVHTGQFRGRLKPKYSVVRHDVATNLIYGSALIGWALGVAAIVFGL